MHFDEVEGLGEFIELEFVLEEDHPLTEGHAIVQHLTINLGIREEDLIDVLTADLLNETYRESGGAMLLFDTARKDRPDCYSVIPKPVGLPLPS